MVDTYRTIEGQLGLTQYTEGGQEIASDVYTATGGALYQAAPYVIGNVLTGEEFSLGQQGDTLLNVLDDGTVEVPTPVGMNRLNAYRVGPGQYDPNAPLPLGGRVTQSSLSGTIDVTIGGIKLAGINVGGISVGPVGGRIYMQQRADGSWKFESTDKYNFRTNVELQAVLGPLVRYATAEEAAAYAIRGQLISQYSQEVNDAAKLYNDANPDAPKMSFSDALDMMYAAGIDQLQAWTVHQIRIA